MGGERERETVLGNSVHNGGSWARSGDGEMAGERRGERAGAEGYEGRRRVRYVVLHVGASEREREEARQKRKQSSRFTRKATA